MPAGLVNIATYGSEDVFLTGTPEITFFKMVYRRHTNFAIESIEIPFDTATGFGTTSNATLKPIGDLIHKTYIKFVTPRVKIRREIDMDQLKAAISDLNTKYTQLRESMAFMNINTAAYDAALEVYQASNVYNSTEMINSILSVFAKYGNYDISDIVQTEPVQYNLFNIAHMFAQTDLNKHGFKAILDMAMVTSRSIQRAVDRELAAAITHHQEISNTGYKFAWADRLGHALIEWVDITIGGQRIDRHYGMWLNI